MLKIVCFMSAINLKTHVVQSSLTVECESIILCDLQMLVSDGCSDQRQGLSLTARRTAEDARPGGVRWAADTELCRGSVITRTGTRPRVN